MATHSSILAWKVPRDVCGIQSMGSQRVGHDWTCIRNKNEHHYLRYSYFIFPRKVVTKSRAFLASDDTLRLRNDVLHISMSTPSSFCYCCQTGRVMEFLTSLLLCLHILPALFVLDQVSLPSQRVVFVSVAKCVCCIVYAFRISQAAFYLLILSCLVCPLHLSQYNKFHESIMLWEKSVLWKEIQILKNF